MSSNQLIALATGSFSTDLSVHVHPINPPLLSNHSLIVADVINLSPLLACSDPELDAGQFFGPNPTQPAGRPDPCPSLPCTVLGCKSSCPSVAQTPRRRIRGAPTNVGPVAMADADRWRRRCVQQLRQLINRHVPCVHQRPRRCTYARWNDEECRAMKRATRRL